MAPTDFWVGPAGRPDTYRLLGMLGGGGEGEVWQAVLPLSAEGRSRVAVKILHPGVGGDDDGQWQQFGHLLRSLSHPGLVRVTDVFSGPDKHRGGAADFSTRVNVVVMDYLDGPTLREWCDENPQATAAQRLRMLRTVAAALDEMHSGRHTQIAVAHGDVKPSNVVVGEGGATVLVDLGLARLADATGVSGRSAPYAAPEQRLPGAMATPDADRFAFAVTTAQILTGQAPPTDRDGWLDRSELESLLRVNPITRHRPQLIRQILQVLDAPPEARPRRLQHWLDSAADTLSQITTGSAPTTPILAPEHTDPGTGAFKPTAKNTRQPAPAPSVLPRRRRWPIYLAVAGLLVVVGGAGATLLLRPATTLAADQPTSPPATTSAVATTEPSTPTESFTPVTTTPDASNTGLPTTTTYLDTLQPVDSDHLSDNGGYESTPASTSGVQYGHAVIENAFCDGNDGGDFWIDYDLGRKWSTFTTTVGLRDDAQANAKITYKVIADNKPLATGTLTLGTANPLTMPVTGALRLRLLINNPTVRTNACRSDKSIVVWGNPTLNP